MTRVLQGMGWVTAGLWLYVGCGAGDVGSVSDAREGWLKARPDTYVSVVCGTGFSGGCVRSVVMGTEVVLYQTNGGPVAEGWEEAVSDSRSPIEDMFENATAPGCTRTSLEVDSDYSYVTAYYLDCGEEGYGEEVVCFAADTSDVDACP